MTADRSSEAANCQRQRAEGALLRTQHRTIFEEREFIYARQLKLSMGKFIEQPATVSMPASHLPSSISLPLCILYTECSESFSCILYTEVSESWTAAALARMVDT